MKTTVKSVMADGREACFQTKMPNAQAALACNIVTSVIASDSLRAVISDEDPQKISPRRIASLACDIANSMYEEFERREWLIEFTPPTVTP